MKTRARMPLAVVLPALLLGVTGSALADGGFLSAPQYIIYERSQSALLRLEDGIEDLCILPEFYGDAEDFVWIVPVPNLPTVSEADDRLFTQLEDLTRPVYRYRDADWGCQDETVYDTAAGNRDGTTILADEIVGIYRSLIIAAEDGADLADSLSAWGYLHVDNEEAVGIALQYYIDRDWYFVAVKVDEKTVLNVDPYRDYRYGLMQPLRFRFAATELVYPLRISALSSIDNSAVHLYVVGEHRMQHGNFDTWYANRITAGELSEIRRAYPHVGDELESGDFLTRLVWNDIRIGEMDEDIYLETAGDDTEMRLINYSGFPLWHLFLAASFAGWLVLRWRIRRRGQKA